MLGLLILQNSSVKSSGFLTRMSQCLCSQLFRWARQPRSIGVLDTPSLVIWFSPSTLWWATTLCAFYFILTEYTTDSRVFLVFANWSCLVNKNSPLNTCLHISMTRLQLILRTKRKVFSRDTWCFEWVFSAHYLRSLTNIFKGREILLNGPFGCHWWHKI